MEKHLLNAIIFLLSCNGAFGQIGMWTWMNGDSIGNSSGNFGIQGVASPTNSPPALYESVEFKDLQGNLWLFGGAKNSSEIFGDLWKYIPSINQWTWVKGTGFVNSIGNYGIQGIPALSNLPPARAWGASSWVDLNGDFWMYGGYNLQNGLMNDLWKYNVATNMWTWSQGDLTPGQPAVYGTLGIPDSSNTPGMRYESNVTLVDNNNNLWLFGGSNGSGHLNDLWKYDPNINQWAWMKGANYLSQLGIYGIKGVPDSANVPGARSTYCHWKDSNGNLWFFWWNRKSYRIV